MTAIVVAVACVLLMVVLLLGAAVAGVTSALGLGGGAPRSASYPPPILLASDPLPSRTADLAWPWGQCTWYVAQHHRVTWRGDAADWWTNAAAKGFATTSVPSVGAVVVYRRELPYNVADGHVALVVAVTMRSYSVLEMNYLGLGRIDLRTIPWPDPTAEGFIP